MARAGEVVAVHQAGVPPLLPRPALVSTRDAAAYLACSPAAIRKWRAQGRLRAFRVGRLVRYRVQDLAAFAGIVHER